VKKYFFFIAAVVLLGVGVRAYLFKVAEISVGGSSILVEFARTPEEREQGLSGRKSLCWNCGLIFIFDQPGIYSFWMRRMYFDIDILWISGEEVVEITFGAKKPLKEDFEYPKERYFNRVPADKVLEVNAGWVEKNGIRVGDRVSYLPR